MDKLKPEFEFAGFAWPRYLATLPSGTLGVRGRMIAKREWPGSYSPSHIWHRPVPLTGQKRDKLYFYLESLGHPGLRWLWCDDVKAGCIRHKGWAHAGDDPVRGVVFRLPKGRGFLAGHSMGRSMISCLEFYIWDNLKDAAIAADDAAREAAELEQENEQDE